MFISNHFSEIVTFTGCPLNDDQKNDKFFSKKKKIKKKRKKMSPKMPKKHFENQVENKLVSNHNKYGTLAYFITNNFNVL